MIKRKQRIAMRDLKTLSGEDADIAAKNRVGGRDLNIFRVMMNHPDLTRRWTVFAGHVLRKQTLPVRERELLILRIGWLNQAEYEWAQHVEIAQRGGVTAAKYSTAEMMDVVFTIGQYNLVSWALNSFGVPLDDFLRVG